MRKKFAYNIISGNEERWADQICRNIMKSDPDYVVFNLTQFDDGTEQIVKNIIPKEKLIFLKNKWEKSFSTARNQCLAATPDDVDYIFYIDMDEILTEESYKEIERILNHDGIFVPLVTILNTLDEKTNMNASLYYPRMFPFKYNGKSLHGTIYFEGTVHNQLIIPKEIPQYRTMITILHYGYSLSKEEMKKKHDRSEELLRAQIEEDNDNFFAHLNLAQLLRAKGDMQGTQKHAKEVLRIIEPRVANGQTQYEHAMIMAHEQLATTYLVLKQPQKTVEHSKFVIENLKQDHLDSLINLGNAYIELNDLEESKFWFKRYLFIKSRYDEYKDNTNLILNHLNSSFIALYNLGIIYSLQKDWENALESFRKTVELEPEFRDSFIKYIHTLKSMNRVNDMNKEIQKYMHEHPKMGYMVYEYLGDIALQDLSIELAKFNYYQAAHLNSEDEDSKVRINTKWDAIKHTFGDLSDSFFDVTKKTRKIRST